MSHPTSQSRIEVEIRMPETAKKAVFNALSPFLFPILQEVPTEDRGIWSVRGMIPPDKSVDLTLLKLEKALVQIEQTLGLPNALFADIRRIQRDADSAHGTAPGTIYRGGCFIVAPPAKPVDTDQNQTALRITAGQAFGDGSHSSTRVALQLIGSLFKKYGHRPSTKTDWCLDAGCGTGVLALAVAATWEGRVLAVDISPEAIQRVKTNRKANQPWGWRVTPVLGELSCCRGPFAVIVANLVPSVHVNTDEILWEALRPGGWLIVAGFRQAQKDLVAGLFLSKGAEERAWCCEQGWMGLLLKKPAVLNAA